MAAENLIQLCYASLATFSSEPARAGPGIEIEVGRILRQCKRNNPKRDIGGVLQYGDGYFFQCLEGGLDRVKAVYARIAEDPRHTDLVVLDERRIASRAFPYWSMKLVPADNQTYKILRRHDLSHFNPYAFDAATVRDLVLACVAAIDPRQQPDQVYDSANQATSSGLKQLIGRL